VDIKAEQQMSNYEIDLSLKIPEIIISAFQPAQIIATDN